MVCLSMPVTIMGLSPRVRRKLNKFDLAQDVRGSISARAEEACCPAHRYTPRRVYLRACGGSRSFAFLAAGLAGLSPRVRRKRQNQSRKPLAIGSISARAEEATIRRNCLALSRVYLRACGGS